MHIHWRAGSPSSSSATGAPDPSRATSGGHASSPPASGRDRIAHLPAGRGASASTSRPAGRGRLPSHSHLLNRPASPLGVPPGFPASVEPAAWALARNLPPEHAREIHRLVHEDGLGHVLLGDRVPRVSPQPGRSAIRLEGHALDATLALGGTQGWRPGLRLVYCEARDDPELGWLPATGFLLNEHVLREACEWHRDVIAARTGDGVSHPAHAVLGMLARGDAALDCVVESIVLGYGRSSGERFEQHLFAGGVAADSEAMKVYIAAHNRRIEQGKPDAEVPAPRVPAFVKDDSPETRGLVDNYLAQGDALQNYLHRACLQLQARDCGDVDLAVTAAIAQAACVPRTTAG
jgi:hypothetical protein